MVANLPVGDDALDVLFRTARTQNGWLDAEVSDALLQEIYEVSKYGPTGANGCPARIVFVKSSASRARLMPAMAEGNLEKTRSAPVTAIIGYDLDYIDSLGKLFPMADARSWFAGNDALIFETAFRNSSLQGAYFMLAARAKGLDCGPMSGFDAERVNAEFFPDGRVKVNFLINLGYGDPSKVHQRLPRFDFDEVCTIL